MIKLASNTIDKEDIASLCEWLLSYPTPQLTKGPVTKTFETEWAKLIGTEYSIYVNSGSSAILLTLSALKQSGRLKNSKIVVPAVSWHTDLSSPMILGMEPILCDCNMEDLSCNLSHLENIFKLHNPAAVILVSVLGLVPKMQEIIDMCDKYNVILLEDACESLGSKFNDKLLGSFGLASFFSLYYGHHLSTIEGGFINTNDKELANVLLSIRNHGWDRDLDQNEQEKLRKEWNTEDFESLYKFYYEGFNCRSTDLQAFIGLKQIQKLKTYAHKRNENFKIYNSNIKNNELDLKQGVHFISNFAYPIVHKQRKKIIQDLKNNEVEVRPLISGSMGNQPFWIKKYSKTSMYNSDIIDLHGFYVPNNQDISKSEIELICSIINKYT